MEIHRDRLQDEIIQLEREISKLHEKKAKLAMEALNESIDWQSMGYLKSHAPNAGEQLNLGEIADSMIDGIDLPLPIKKAVKGYMAKHPEYLVAAEKKLDEIIEKTVAGRLESSAPNTEGTRRRGEISR